MLQLCNYLVLGTGDCNIIIVFIFIIVTIGYKPAVTVSINLVNLQPKQDPIKVFWCWCCVNAAVNVQTCFRAIRLDKATCNKSTSTQLAPTQSVFTVCCARSRKAVCVGVQAEAFSILDFIAPSPSLTGAKVQLLVERHTAQRTLPLAICVRSHGNLLSYITRSPIGHRS